MFNSSVDLYRICAVSIETSLRFPEKKFRLLFALCEQAIVKDGEPAQDVRMLFERFDCPFIESLDR
jgi:hypothetical protein